MQIYIKLVRICKQEQCDILKILVFHRLRLLNWKTFCIDMPCIASQQYLLLQKAEKLVTFWVHTFDTRVPCGIITASQFQ